MVAVACVCFAADQCVNDLLHAQVLVVRRVHRRWPTWRAVWQLDVHERDAADTERSDSTDWERGDRGGECEQRMLGWDRAADTACWMPDDRHPSLPTEVFMGMSSRWNASAWIAEFDILRPETYTG